MEKPVSILQPHPHGQAPIMGRSIAAMVIAVMFFAWSDHTSGEPQKGDAFHDKQLGITAEILGSVENREENLKNAAALYKSAAARGNARAQQLLSNAYRHGRGVPKSDFLALVWYLTAGFMCLAEEWPPNPPSLENLSSSDEKAASEMAAMLATMQRLQQVLSPDCGEYFDKETWVGFIYPNRDNKLAHELGGTYRALSSCRSSSQKKIRENGWENADYECGVSCRREDSGPFGGNKYLQRDFAVARSPACRCGRAVKLVRKSLL